MGGGVLNRVNHVSGPLGVRSRKPNGLIREEGVDDRNGQQRGERAHLQPHIWDIFEDHSMPVWGSARAPAVRYH